VPEDAETTGIQSRLVIEYGIELDGIWLPLGMLRRLGEHGPWSTPFSEATAEQADVLLAHGLAERHNTGLRRGNGLQNFLDATPYEPTMPFGKVDASTSDARPDRGHGRNGSVSG
jgi:hypothetical protein